MTFRRVGSNFQNVLKPETEEPSTGLRGPSAEIDVAEKVGRLMHFWGFKRPMGRAWTILYLSPRPLSAAELGSRLSMSAGGISMTLAELEKWGCVERTYVPGERREYFVAESNIWKMVQRVLRERELSLVQDFARALSAAAATLDEAEEASFKRERLGRLEQLAGTGETLLSALVDGGSVDPTLLIQPQKQTRHTHP